MNLAPKSNGIPVNLVQVDPTASRLENSKQSQRNSVPWRQPHWTDFEVRTLLKECDRYRDVMVSRTLNAAEEQKKSKEEKQQVWEIITETINNSGTHIGANDADSGKTAKRTVKCVVKKWVNLISKMKNEFEAQKKNPRANICGTSRAVHTILYTDDKLDLDKVLGPLSPPNELRLPGEQSPDILDNFDISNKFQSIAPRPGPNLILKVAKTGENIGDCQQTNNPSQQTNSKRKLDEIESIKEKVKLPLGPWSHKKPRKYKKKIKKNMNDYSDCWQRRIPNSNIIGINSVFSNNSVPIKIAIPRNPVQNVVLKNEIPNNIFFLENEAQSNNINSVQSDGKVEDKSDDFTDNHINDNEGVAIQNCVNSNDVSVDENSEEEFRTHHNPEPLNGDMYTDDFMQLNKEVLELKKQKLLTKIDKLILEREKAVYDKERAIIEKETAKMAHEKMQLELESLKRSLGNQVKEDKTENLLEDIKKEMDTVGNERTFEEEMIANDSESQEGSSDENPENEF